MSQQSGRPDRSSASPGEQPKVDPWQSVGYLVAGVAAYGVLGWLADQWLGTSFLVAVGIVVGAGLGIYLTIVRLTHDPESRSKS